MWVLELSTVWPCPAAVSRRFDGFYGKGGRSALYIFAAEHGLLEPWQGWYGRGGLAGGGYGIPTVRTASYVMLIGVCPDKDATPDGDYEPRPSPILLCHPRPVPTA
jgi:hypothetical protein